MIKPITVDDTVFISSSIAENDHAEWSGASVSYSVGDKRIRVETHRIYECNTAHTSTASEPPETNTKWTDIGPTNQRAMFDNVIGTSSSATDQFNVEIAPGYSGAAAFFNLVGESLTVTQLDSAGGSTIKEEITNLDDTPILSFYDYFFTDFVQKETVIIQDLFDNYLNSRLKVTIDGTGTVSIGVMQVGALFDWGDLKYGAQLRIEDFSKKSTDSFGNTIIVKRANRKIVSGQLIVPFEQFSQLNILARDLQSEAAVYIGVDEVMYEPLSVFGFVSDFSITIQYHKYLLCNIEIEGLV